jgi:hypothetical protein
VASPSSRVVATTTAGSVLWFLLCSVVSAAVVDLCVVVALLLSTWPLKVVETISSSEVEVWRDEALRGRTVVGVSAVDVAETAVVSSGTAAIVVAVAVGRRAFVSFLTFSWLLPATKKKSF